MGLFMPMLVIVGLFNSTPVCTGQERKSDLDRAWSGFPACRWQKLKELDPDASPFFLNHHSKNNPGVVRADFDGDSNLDYARILRNDKSEGAKLGVLLCCSEGHCRNVSELDISGYSDSAFLAPRQRAREYLKLDPAKRIVHP